MADIIQTIISNAEAQRDHNTLDIVLDKFDAAILDVSSIANDANIEIGTLMDALLSERDRYITDFTAQGGTKLCITLGSAEANKQFADVFYGRTIVNSPAAFLLTHKGVSTEKQQQTDSDMAAQFLKRAAEKKAERERQQRGLEQ